LLLVLQTDFTKSKLTKYSLLVNILSHFGLINRHFLFSLSVQNHSVVGFQPGSENLGKQVMSMFKDWLGLFASAYVIISSNLARHSCWSQGKTDIWERLNVNW